MSRQARLPGAILAAVFICAGCAVERVPVGAGPPFLRAAGLARVSDLHAVSPPAWAPDGRLLAFSTADAVWSVRAAPGDLDRRRVASLAGVERVAWSPDGRALVALAGGRLFVVALDDPTPRPLVAARGVRDPAWPPTGRRVFERSTDACAGPAYATGAGPTTLWTVRAGGRAARVASLASDLEVRAITWLAADTGLAVSAAPPGGRADRVLYLRSGARAAPRTQMLPAGGRDPVPSPEGRFIAYLQNAGGPAPGGSAGDTVQIAVMRADGSGRRVLTPPGRYSSLAWSPAGTVLAYARQEAGRTAIEIADVLTGERLWLGDHRSEPAASPTPIAIVWAPDGSRLAFDTGTNAGFVWIATLERR